MKEKKIIITLNNGEKQEVSIRKGGHIAGVKSGKIFANEDFLKLSHTEQKTIVYHEKFHLTKNAKTLAFLAVLFFLFFLVGLIFIKIYLSVLIILLSVVFFWSNEILADRNAVRNMGRKNTLNIVLELY